MGPIDPAKFIPTLHEDGSIETLQGLVQRLVERLQWRSNQGDPLFPSPYSGCEETSPVHSRTGDSTATADPLHSQNADPVGTESVGTESVETKSAAAEFASTESANTESVATKPAVTESATTESVAAMAGKGFSDDEKDVALCLPDAILARAILGPPGVAVALASTAKRNRRHRASEDGGGSGGGGIDDERWRREVRAIETGEGSTITVAEGAAAAERVLREIKAWEARGRGARKSLYIALCRNVHCNSSVYVYIALCRKVHCNSSVYFARKIMLLRALCRKMQSNNSVCYWFYVVRIYLP